MRAGPIMLALLALAGCDDPKPAGERAAAPAQPAATDARTAEALRVAEERLRARLRSEEPLVQRAIVVHRQSMADTLAVCGQVNPSGRPEDPFIPYVAVIGFEGDRATRGEFHLAASSPEATRVYLEMVDRCFDGGGPATGRSLGRALPPVPSGLPRNLPGEAPRAPAAPAMPAAPQAALPPAATPLTAPSTPAQGHVTTSSRTPVNVRSSPSGGGEVMRVVPRASTLQVFGEAPGGWVQVGEGEPWGWVHNSMLEGR